MNCNIKLRLAVFGDTFDLNELTNLVNLKPTNTYLKGDIIEGYTKVVKRKESSWSYSIKPLETLYFSEYANELLEKFEEKVLLIREFSRNNDLMVKLFIVLEMSEDQTPAFYMDRRFLKFVNDLNAEMDVDMYII